MNGPRVLIVEDEPLTALALRELATHAGMDVVGTASSILGALDIVQGTQPELAIMDINLAGRRDGVAGAMLLRQQFGINVIFLTAQCDPATRARAALAEPLAFLAKPCSGKDLLEAMRIACARSPRPEPLAQRPAGTLLN